MGGEIAVSVCCLTYNHELFLERTLEGFLSQQTNFKFEILIHDDASTDRTVDIIKRYQDKYPDIIKPIFQKTNQWSQNIRALSVLYNFPRAQGKYIAMCEGDDFWIDPFKLQMQYDFLEANAHCSLVFTGCEIRKDTGEKKVMRYKTGLNITPNEYLSNGYFISTASIFFTSRVVQAPSEEWMPKSFAGDFILKYKLLLLGNFGYIDSITCVYNKGVEGSWSKRSLTKSIILKEYSDNLRGLYYLCKYSDIQPEVRRSKVRKLKETVYFKIALSKSSKYAGLFYLLSNLPNTSYHYVGAFIKRNFRWKKD